ncbi:enoyl-CoA hydratase/isomerase family protein [Amycolatopsis sp. CA-230715]|uniref:enoyl-CoA hydratase/isomerase family protein n=1 Tax=Amycolatopsis sp. CA-230715 TaxID=2745196 RepID=UPI001C017166|nr:enoyl-CoA hydratase/isomerase family protein [Amycolatopsis sp. CA-230715]QWF78494.1 1,4-dihydroxy-2-naphthoyl-CoA synthase [Amycolatopsis sp. CA-230715]
MTEVRTSVHNGLGRITLNRPKAINALTHDMVRVLGAVLDDWAGDDLVRAVLIDGAGERGLCAGGDIRAIYQDARSGGTASLPFWADEYRLNARIARYPKPYVALMDGLVMGGGVGVSAHGSVRVVTERSRIGMPETGIGFVPDVGGTYLLSRTPGQLGTHIALTAGQISGADAIYCGLADYYVPSGRLGELAEALANGETVRSFAEPAPESELARQRDWIDACYSADTVEEILERLSGSGEAASSAAKEIAGKSPTSLKVTLRALRTAKALPDLETVLAQEFRVSSAALRSPDLAEGIRAQIIDKDRNPRWSPGTLGEVGDDLVASFFAPLEDEWEAGR